MIYKPVSMLERLENHFYDAFYFFRLILFLVVWPISALLVGLEGRHPILVFFSTYVSASMLCTWRYEKQLRQKDIDTDGVIRHYEQLLRYTQRRDK